MVRPHFKNFYTMIINNKILLSFLLLFSVLHGHQSEQESDRWINVSGTGKVSASPDLAILRMGVLSTAKTAKLATELNNASILKIFDVLEEMGVDEEHYETARFQITPQRQYRKGLPPLVTGYQVSNIIIVRIYDLDRVGEIMQTTVDAGGNNFESLSFALDDNEEYVEEARVRAMEDALNKAEILAGALASEKFPQVKVGLPLTIQELGGSNHPIHARRMMHSDAMMAESVPVQAPSELSTEVRVQVKFALE